MKEVKASSSCGCLRGCKLRQQQKLLGNWKIDRIHADWAQKKIEGKSNKRPIRRDFPLKRCQFVSLAFLIF